MYLHIDIYVCLHTYIYICLHVHMCVYKNIISFSMYSLCVYIYVYVYIYAYIYIYIYIERENRDTEHIFYMQMCKHAFVSASVCVFSERLFVYVYVCMYVCVCMNGFVFCRLFVCV